jgi:hydrogenase expression/formation protein HypC
VCLAIPMRITAIAGTTAEIEADGLQQRASLMLVPQAAVGDFVLVHAGYALTVVDAAEAEETLRLFAEIEAAEDAGAARPDQDDERKTDELDDGRPAGGGPAVSDA